MAVKVIKIKYAKSIVITYRLRWKINGMAGQRQRYPAMMTSMTLSRSDSYKTIMISLFKG